MEPLTTAPLWLSALLIVGTMTIGGMVGPVVVRKLFEVDRLDLNNEVAGFKFATIGVIYAVILGFAVIVVWEKFETAERVVSTEAGALAAIQRLAAGLDTEAAAALLERTRLYTRAVINDDWPAMIHGKGSRTVTEALSKVYVVVLDQDPATRRGAVALAEILRQLDVVTQTRRDRLMLANGIVPNVVWIVLIAGAAVTITFTFFFGSKNLLAQATMAGLLSFLISLGLLTIVSIDRPFTGPTSVSPEPLELLMQDFPGG